MKIKEWFMITSSYKLYDIIHPILFTGTITGVFYEADESRYTDDV